MAHQYRKPPILEASFEARFDTSPNYNVFTPLRVYDELSADYQSEPVLISDQGIEIVEDSREGSDTTFRLKKEQYRYQIASPDAAWILRFNRRLLSVHASAPYPGWNAFRERIHKSLKAYLLVAQPASLQRISIRYVNQITFDEEPVDLADYFVAPPDTPRDSATSIGAFFQRLECFWPDQPFRLVQTFASAPDEKLSVILDLDMISEENAPLGGLTEDLAMRIDRLREMQRETFEAVITDKLRGMFNAA
ncbi:TIGR04255 family protein [Micromonospora echinofusca]|uniref:TIGR04255 family protein n=1 Tax=Micromonospora echinofusca TaxID=47858 RepID=UPI0033DE121F